MSEVATGRPEHPTFGKRKTTPLTLKPPNGELFAAVQVEHNDHPIGANPAFALEGTTMVPTPSVTVDCYLPLDAKTLTVHWVYEDSTRGLETVTHTVGKHGRGWRR